MPPLKNGGKCASIIALDLGRRTGWAYKTRDGETDSGVHEVYDPNDGIKRFEDGVRFRAFRDFVHTLDQQMGLADIIAFEQVSGGMQGHQNALYNGYRAVLMAWASDQGRVVVPLPVGTIKRAACGKGNAKKDDVIDAVRTRLGLPTFDDNEADAIAMRDFALPMIEAERIANAAASKQDAPEEKRRKRSAASNRPARKKTSRQKHAGKAAGIDRVSTGIIRESAKKHAPRPRRARPTPRRQRRG
jgi:crossover junction endodeoxyribonuclease RuvC